MFSDMDRFDLFSFIQKPPLVVKKTSHFSQTKSLDFDAQSKRKCLIHHKSEYRNLQKRVETRKFEEHVQSKRN